MIARRTTVLQNLARCWEKNLQDDATSRKILPQCCKILQDKHLKSTEVDKFYIVLPHFFGDRNYEID